MELRKISTTQDPEHTGLSNASEPPFMLFPCLQCFSTLSSCFFTHRISNLSFKMKGFPFQEGFHIPSQGLGPSSVPPTTAFGPSVTVQVTMCWNWMCFCLSYSL